MCYWKEPGSDSCYVLTSGPVGVGNEFRRFLLLLIFQSTVRIHWNAPVD